jgi:hypothetical protein
MRKQLHILTYDSIPTDLAGEMRRWPEFVAGQDYTVHLRDAQTGEEVNVCMRDTPDDVPTVVVDGPSRSALLDKVLGRVAQALAEHSDNLMLDDRTIAEPGAAPNGGPAASIDNSNAPGGPPSVS